MQVSRQLALVFLSLFVAVKGHGRLADPPSRNAMWMYQFPNKVNYNPNEMNCGGTTNQWETNGGRCGLCGDPYQGPRIHEAGYPGGYANGVIGRVYKQGQTIDVMVEITANHFGWFEFRLCPTNDPSKPITQQCLDRYLLRDTSGQSRVTLQLKGYKGTVKLKLVLPADVVCSHCVLQWFWYGGNSRDRIAQETFVNCADVVITKPDGKLGGGLVMPKIPAQAYKPIPETKHRLGQGKLINLPGEWDCVVPPPHGNTEKKNVFYEWCLENCLYANPKDRSCPVETCRCFRTDIKMSPEREKELLGIKKEYPKVQSNGRVRTSAAGELEGSWECDVQPPFNKNPEKKKMFYHWCMEHCIRAKPHERDCPESHCRCRRTDKNLSASETRGLLRRTAPPARQAQRSQPTTTSRVDDRTWKTQAKIRPNPRGLQGSWDCDVKSPYNAQPDKRLFYYEWCLKNCINSDHSDRHCAETHCDCYRTDVKLSPEQIRAQLSLSGKVVVFTEQDGRARGIPPALSSIVQYAGQVNAGNKRPALQGTWDCKVVSPFDRDPAKKAYYQGWCQEHCIKAQPNDRYCPETHCSCFRTDVQQSAAENRRQLATGVNAKGIIHAEGGESGAYDFEKRRPNVSRNAVTDSKRARQLSLVAQQTSRADRQRLQRRTQRRYQ